ncbi:ion transporter [Nocardioides sp.]|uniref:ion transporter n=1 Tax=Nocardioides sp. TaxID=35761 RepID=UPI00351762D5
MSTAALAARRDHLARAAAGRTPPEGEGPAGPGGPEDPAGPVPARRRRPSRIDLLMVALALVSVGLLGYVMLADPPREVEHRIFLIDAGICAIFLVEFLARWRRSGQGWVFVARNWYEVLGMIPVSHPALRGFRLVRVVLLVVRLLRVTDRAFGAGFTYRLAQRFAEPIVEAIRRPVTLAVLDEVVAVLETGDYPANLAASLNENREELRGIVAEKLRDDPAAGRLRRLPFHDDVVEGVVDTGFRVVLEVLRDERIDAFFAHVVSQNRAQIRQAVEEGLNRPRVRAQTTADRPANRPADRPAD